MLVSRVMNNRQHTFINKRFTFALSIIVLLFCIVIYSACTKTPSDTCENLSCLNGGTCTNGKCVCPTGFIGTNCELNDPCLNVTCQHGGTCSGGTCSCPTGYEGAYCETRSRDKFVGTYKGSEACTIGSDNYVITLAAQTDETKLTLTNLYNYSIPLTATCTLVATDSFTFSGANGKMVYSGTGRLTATSLILRYTISNNGTTNACVFTGVK